jgi:hypothetical protein
MSKELRKMIRQILFEGDVYDITGRLPKRPGDPIEECLIETFLTLQDLIQTGVESPYTAVAGVVMDEIKGEVGVSKIMSYGYDAEEDEDY